MQQVATTGARSVPEHPQASYYRARYYDLATGRFINEDPGHYELTNLYIYVVGNPVRWRDPFGLWKCDSGTSCDLNPDLKASLDNLEKCAGLPPGQPLVVTCGTTGHPPQIKNGIATGDPHFYGVAVDIGQNANPGLS
jgi:RHS repeat-associated protein